MLLLLQKLSGWLLLDNHKPVLESDMGHLPFVNNTVLDVNEMEIVEVLNINYLNNNNFHNAILDSYFHPDDTSL